MSEKVEKKDLDGELEEYTTNQRSVHAKKLTRLYNQLRHIHRYAPCCTERFTARALEQAHTISAAAVYLCIRYLAQFTRAASTYHPEVGSYKLYTIIDKWVDETCKQKHELCVAAVIEACRLMELLITTDPKNPLQVEIAFRFIWEKEETEDD